jgi:hypothetical protein
MVMRFFEKSLTFRAPAGILAGMSGITFMVDESGKKTAAVIDLRRHRKVWEDFHDILLAESRAHEPRESLESVRQRLRRGRKNG